MWRLDQKKPTDRARLRPSFEIEITKYGKSNRWAKRTNLWQVLSHGPSLQRANEPVPLRSKEDNAIPEAAHNENQNRTNGQNICTGIMLDRSDQPDFVIKESGYWIVDVNWMPHARERKLERANQVQPVRTICLEPVFFKHERSRSRTICLNRSITAAAARTTINGRRTKVLRRFTHRSSKWSGFDQQFWKEYQHERIGNTSPRATKARDEWRSRLFQKQQA